jgi:beta-galactosidase GanA
MRTCSNETKAKLMRRNAPPLHPGWVLSAYWDALNNKPMSVNREKKLCEAMGLNKPPRASRRFYRPCLSVELGEIMREYGWSPEVILWQWVREYQAQEAPCQS